MEFKIKWSLCPHNQHQQKVSIVQAPNAEAAERVIEDHILRKHQTDWFTVFEVAEYTPLPESLGKVVA